MKRSWTPSTSASASSLGEWNLSWFCQRLLVGTNFAPSTCMSFVSFMKLVSCSLLVLNSWRKVGFHISGLPFCKHTLPIFPQVGPGSGLHQTLYNSAELHFIHSSILRLISVLDCLESDASHPNPAHSLHLPGGILPLWCFLCQRSGSTKSMCWQLFQIISFSQAYTKTHFTLKLWSFNYQHIHPREHPMPPSVTGRLSSGVYSGRVSSSAA